jgi:hypothetical protein
MKVFLNQKFFNTMNIQHIPPTVCQSEFTRMFSGAHLLLRGSSPHPCLWGPCPFLSHTTLDKKLYHSEFLISHLSHQNNETPYLVELFREA